MILLIVDYLYNHDLLLSSLLSLLVDMGRNCCVPNCRGNYKNAKIFRLPSENRYPEERSRWIKSIPRDDIPSHKNTSICEEHWPSGYETISRHGQLRPLHPPTIFNGFKTSSIPTPPAPARTTTRALSEIRHGLR